MLAMPSHPPLTPMHHPRRTHIAHILTPQSPCSLISSAETNPAPQSGPAAKLPRRSRALPPLRLDLDGAQTPRPAPGAALTPQSAHSSGISATEWMDRMEAQLSSRGRRLATPPAAMRDETAEGQHMLVPPAFVCLGLLGGSYP